MNFAFRNPTYAAKNPIRTWRVTRAHARWVKGRVCEFCGGAVDVEVHDIKPVRQMKTEAEALDETNWCALCRKNDCHRVAGHFGNYWTGINPVVDHTCSFQARLLGLPTHYEEKP